MGVNTAGKKILVIEDSKFYSSMVQKNIRSDLGFETVPAMTYKETEKILENDTDFFAAVVDLKLPDAMDGEVVDLVLSKKIPAIILTGSFDEGTREKILKKNVVDYIVKQQTKGFKPVTDLIGRLVKNQSVKVLIAEDSSTQRLKLKKLLKAQMYIVLEAEDGEQALRLIGEHPDVKLVLTDYNMPGITGFELVRQLREKYDKNSLAIIGVSSEGEGVLSAMFLKSGANDFVSKPFVPEELVIRVAQNIDMIDMVKTLKDLAIKDPLTRLYNRRYFFLSGAKKFKDSRDKGAPLSVAMIDLDFFKKVNDEHGHDAGDEVLRQAAKMLLENTRGADVVARLGGEEFCVIAHETDRAGAEALFEKIRSRFEEAEIEYEGKKIRITVSIGVACGEFDTLENMLKHSDAMLYAAKSAGRNRVAFEA